MLLGAVSGLSLLTGATGSAAVWDGSTDTSWYNTTDTVFTLTDGADLAGFAAIVNGTAEGITQTNFEGKTVRLGANIVLNEGDAKTWGPSTAGLQAFPMIGLQDSSYSFANVAKYFSGEFDGQGHTISGMYVNRKCNARGEGSAMFAGIYGGARIHDFALVNSFVQASFVPFLPLFRRKIYRSAPFGVVCHGIAVRNKLLPIFKLTYFRLYQFQHSYTPLYIAIICSAAFIPSTAALTMPPA